ncbi:MAG: PEGA domain-containing protein [Gammaproteobacteria bacterium]|nr:PEGA domain-containing protein [Gammaproteobacteria bacterium]MBI5616964.1 PEGA domain-containing protein [Gammaproteobacteria bacterium]
MNSPAGMPPETPLEPVRFRPPGPLAHLPELRLPWRRMFTTAWLALALATAWYVLAARSIDFDLSPPDAKLTVLGFAPRVSSHWMLLPGEHEVSAEAPGHLPYHGTIHVGSDAHQVLPIVMKPRPGRLDVKLDPPVEATIDIDGKPAGKAPGIVADVESGTRELVVKSERYLPFTATLEVAGRGETQPFTATLVPAWAAFTLTTKPAGAIVTIDRTVAGRTPLRHELIQGERELTVELKGYKPWRRHVKVVAGQPVAFKDVVLEKADGTLDVTSDPPGAALTIDGRYAGVAPQRLALAPDADHDLTAFKEGYGAEKRTLRVASGEVRALAVTLAPELAPVRLDTTPADAELLVDGQPAGSATQVLSLPTTEHELVVRKRGYASYQTTVTPRRGVEKRLRIELKTAAEMQAELAANPEPPPPAPPAQATAAAPAASTAGSPTAAPSNAAPAAKQAPQGEVEFVEAETKQATPPQEEPLRKTFTGQELKRFEGGEFLMGTIARDPGHRTNEIARQVRLSRPFWISVREVSNREFRQFVTTHSSGASGTADLNADSLPVANVSWEEAALYCNWLSRQDKLPVFYQIKYGKVLGVHPEATGYRLPTEAEWEWAARTTPDGETLHVPWTGPFPPRGRVGNFADLAARELIGKVIPGYEDGFAGSAPVGSYPPNLRGLYDMAGNVAEWVHDFHAAEDTPGVQVDPLGPASGTQHVVRGSSWADADPALLRLAARAAGQGPRNDLGFRIARYAQ